MKKTNFIKTMLLLCALIVGSGSVWASTKTEGFESASTSTTYNSTVTVAANKSDCDIAWSIYYGTVSTNDKISGSKSAQMRWYASATTNYPYIKSTTAVDGLTNISLKARTSNLNVKMDVSYSADGENWTVGKTHTFSKTGTGESVSLDIPSGNKFVKFGVNSTSTAPSSDYYKLIVDDVVFTYSSSLTPATWTVDPALATVTAGESTVLSLDTNYDGTLTFTSNDEDVAEVSYNSSDKEITVTGVAAGSTTISVTGAATATYEAISKSITVNVNHAEYASNVTDVMSDFGYAYFGLTPSGSNTYAQPEVTSTDKTDSYGVTISFAKASGSYYPRYDPTYVRFYQNNTLTVTVPAGSYITKIVFTEPAAGAKWDGSMSVGTGEYVNTEKTWYATSTDVTSLVLTGKEGTNRIGGMKVYFQRSTVPVSVTAVGYATFASPYNLNFSGMDLTAYKAIASGDEVSFESVGQVPGGEGLLIKANEGTYNVPVIASAAAIDNALIGVTEETVVDGAGIYVLYNGTSGIGFYQTSASSFTIRANSAYLPAGIVSAREFIPFEDETTSISDVRSKMSDVKGEYFDLQGRKVAQPTKGLYIMNGKKVIIK